MPVETTRRSLAAGRRIHRRPPPRRVAFRRVVPAVLVVLAIGGCPRRLGLWAACARIEAPAIDECSGLEHSRRHPDVLWTHNDSGDEARIFAIDRRGRLLCEVGIDGATNVDWEDIASDDAGQIYIGDFGNNRNRRRDLVVYVVDEPDPGRFPAAGKMRLAVKRRLPFHYPDQRAFPDSAALNFDCEAMFWDGGMLYLLTKHRSDIQTALYRLDPKATGEQAAVRIASLDVGSPVTAAELAPDGRLLAILSYQYILLVAQTVPRANDDYLAGTVHRVTIEGRQCEAVCFDGDRLLFTNEQREIHCVGLAYLQTHSAYLPDPPSAPVPFVDPVLDARPLEWRGRRPAGRLVFDRYVTTAGTAAGRAAIPEVRLGWTNDGLLFSARWMPSSEARPAEPVLFVMAGSGPAAEPTLGPGHAVWAGYRDGDALRFERRWPRAAAAEARVTARREAAALEVEALLPLDDADALRPGGELLFDVVVREPHGADWAEWAWSASSDMQPLENPLLWGRLLLQAR